MRCLYQKSSNKNNVLKTEIILICLYDYDTGTWGNKHQKLKWDRKLKYQTIRLACIEQFGRVQLLQVLHCSCVILTISYKTVATAKQVHRSL